MTGAVGDLATPTDVHDLVTRFYREIVFDAGGYPRSVTKVHRHLHGQRPIEPDHCDRWFSLWALTIDTGWTGPYADRAKDHAATLMAGMAKHVFGFTWTAPDRAEVPTG